MRFFLAVGLLFVLCASAAAARLHPSQSRHAIAYPGEVLPWHAAAPGWAYAPLGSPAYRSYAGPRPDPYDDTPSYDDPSKFGG